MPRAEINIFIGSGVGHIKYLMDETILESYDDDGNPILRDTTAADVVAFYTGLTDMLTNAGHVLGRAVTASEPAQSKPAGNGPLPPGMAVPMHCGQPCEFKEAFVNPRTKRAVPAKYQCVNDSCPDIATTKYKWSIFVDRWIKEQEGQ